MSPTLPPPAEFAPLFDWSPPRSRKAVLLGFVAASTALHALCFYLFQITYPTTVALVPPPARVDFINPDSEDGRLLLRWIEAEDPALTSTTARPPGTAALQPTAPKHVPSYVGRSAQLRPPPPSEPALAPPSARPPGPVPATPAVIAPSVEESSTQVRFGEGAADFGEPKVPRVQFRATRAEAPQAARFRLGLDRAGAVRFCFLEKSSGDPSLDATAREQLLLTRFPEMPEKTTLPNEAVRWTSATLEWGSDIALPAASPNETKMP